MTRGRRATDPTPEQLALHLRRRRAAAARVRPGTVLELYTEDCFGGRVRSGRRPAVSRCASSRTSTRSPGRSTSRAPSPATPSRCTSSTIAPARDWAVSADVPALRRADRHAHHGDAAAAAGGGGLALRRRRGSAAPCAIPPATRRLRAWSCRWTRCTARSASRRRRSRSAHDDHPGRARRQHGHPGAAGRRRPSTSASTCPGALFALGDGHCRQGQGEVCGTAVEAAMNTVRRRRPDQGRRPRRGRGWRPTTYLMSTGSARPLEDAYRISQHDLVTWAAELTGLDSSTPTSWSARPARRRSATSCDTNYTMVAKLAKRYLRLRRRRRATACTPGCGRRPPPTSPSAEATRVLLVHGCGPRTRGCLPAQRLLARGSRTALIRWQSGQAVRPTPRGSTAANPRSGRWPRTRPAPPRRPAPRPGGAPRRLPGVHFDGRVRARPAVRACEPDGVVVHTESCAPGHSRSIPGSGDSPIVESPAAQGPAPRYLRLRARERGDDDGSGQPVGGRRAAGRRVPRRAGRPSPSRSPAGDHPAVRLRPRAEPARPRDVDLLRRAAPRRLRQARPLGRPHMGAVHLSPVRRTAARRIGRDRNCEPVGVGPAAWIRVAGARGRERDRSRRGPPRILHRASAWALLTSLRGERSVAPISMTAAERARAAGSRGRPLPRPARPAPARGEARAARQRRDLAPDGERGHRRHGARLDRAAAPRPLRAVISPTRARSTSSSPGRSACASRARARARRCTWSGRVPGVSVTCSLLRGCCRVGDPAQARRGAKSLPVLSPRDLRGGRTSHACAAVYWPGGSGGRAGKPRSPEADLVVAYGGDEAVRSVRGRAPRSRRPWSRTPIA